MVIEICVSPDEIEKLVISAALRDVSKVNVNNIDVRTHWHIGRNSITVYITPKDTADVEKETK